MIENERQFWNDFWGNERNYTISPHSSLILASERVLGDYIGKNTLEVGAGRGVDSIEMARRGATSFIIDFSESSFNIPLNLSRESGVKVICCQSDATRLPITDNFFDLVFSQGLLEHPGLMESVLPEQVRVTKPGGFILIDVPQFFSIQAIIKWVELQIGTWPYGSESNFTERGLRKILEGNDLRYVSSYGRGLIPIVDLRIRKALLEIYQKGSLLNTTARKELMQALELSWIGPKVLNNVGIISQKPTG